MAKKPTVKKARVKKTSDVETNPIERNKQIIKDQQNEFYNTLLDCELADASEQPQNPVVKRVIDSEGKHHLINLHYATPELQQHILSLMEA